MTTSPLHRPPVEGVAAVAAATAGRMEWRRLTALLLMVLSALTALFWTTAASLVRSWAQDPLAHGYIIVPAVLYLTWQRRHLLQEPPTTSEWLAVSAVAGCAVV